MAGRALRIDKDEKEKEESATKLNQRIRERAHEIYLARGGEGGSEIEDWLQAESELGPKQSEPAGKSQVQARSSHRN